MGIDFFRRTLELERQYAAPGQRILNTMQTNATLLDDEWCAFLKENDFLVGVSIDGPREMHDAYRVDKGGKPTFDRVMRGLDALKRHGVEWNALTTVNSANGDHGREVYTFLRDELGATFVQLIPIVERVTAELLPLAESGWGSRSGDRPLYRQEGDLVTHRTVGAAGVRPVPRRRLRGVGPARRRRRVRVDVRHRPGALDGHGPGRPVRARPHLRRRRGAGAQRRPLLVRPLRRARLPARQHRRGPHHARAGEPAPAAGLRAGQARHPAASTAGRATCGSPATAAAPRTGSSAPPTASPGCTTSAPATRTSSTTSTARCG